MSPAKSHTEILHPGCKINVYLKIVGIRDDGYHLLESLFIPLATPCDTLEITQREGSGMMLRCDDPAMPIASNTLTKAYDRFAREIGFAPGLAVFLRKKTPSGAGLGGGSADAAVLLRYLNTLAEQDGASLPEDSLNALAATIGADVPFFLLNRPALVRGIGDILEEVPNPLPGWHLVLVCPALHVNTAWAFRAWDENNSLKNTRPDLTSEPEPYRNALVHGLCVENDLSPVVFAQYPELAKITTRLSELGAKAASMSGSGASLFGLFDEKSTAEKALEDFKLSGYTVFHHIL